MRNVGIIGGEAPKEVESSEGSPEGSLSDHGEKAVISEKGGQAV